jgi:hypothetical protein
VLTAAYLPKQHRPTQRRTYKPRHRQQQRRNDEEEGAGNDNGQKPLQHERSV